MRYWIVVFAVMLLFVWATLASADKFGGPSPRKPAPPADTTQVDTTAVDTVYTILSTQYR